MMIKEEGCFVADRRFDHYILATLKTYQFESGGLMMAVIFPKYQRKITGRGFKVEPEWIERVDMGGEDNVIVYRNR